MALRAGRQEVIATSVVERAIGPVTATPVGAVQVVADGRVSGNDLY